MKELNKKTDKKSFFAKLKSFWSELFFPSDFKCIFCGSDIPNFDESPICDECAKESFFNDKNKCLICSEPIDDEATVCDSCKLHKKSFKKAFCPFVYDGRVRRAILAYKDSNKRYLAKSFVKYIADEIRKSDIEISFLTFVPLSEKKKKKRGFDQSELLAEELSKELNVKLLPLFEKLRDGKTQKKLTIEERFENTKGMYKLLPHRFDKTESVLIVDDVITTGATINACSELLKKKVENVYVASIARNKLGRKKNK